MAEKGRDANPRATFILQQLFGLPPAEVLLEDFSCAIRTRLLLHGRLYVCSSCLCFYSNIFGHETKRVLPFRHITSLRKVRATLLSPAVQVNIQRGALKKQYVFTSFFSGYRDECLALCTRLIQAQRAACGPGALPFTVGTPPSSAPAEPPPTPIAVPPPTPPEDLAVSDGGSSDDGEGGGEEDPGGGAADDPPQPAVALESYPPPPTNLLAEFDALTPVLDTTLPLPVEQFFSEFFAEDARFPLADFHRGLGHSEVEVTEWGAVGAGSGEDAPTISRTMRYRMPLPPGTMTPDSTRVEKGVQLVRYWCGEGGGGGADPPPGLILVIHGSARSFDVPFGGCFTTDERMLVCRAAEDGATRVRVAVTVTFTKSTLFKSQIVPRAEAGAGSLHTAWHEAAMGHLATRTAPGEVLQRMAAAEAATAAAAEQAAERNTALRALPSLPVQTLTALQPGQTPAYTILLDKELPLPVTQFYEEFLGEGARFGLPALQGTLGHTDVQVTPWASGAAEAGAGQPSPPARPPPPEPGTPPPSATIAHRVFNFRMPLPKSAFAPSTTRVRKSVELHQCWVKEGDEVCGPPGALATQGSGVALSGPPPALPPGLVLAQHEASQSLDVPMSDCFVTHTLWLAFPGEGGDVTRVVVGVAIVFTKFALAASIIQAKGLQGSAEFLDQWYTASLQHLIARRQEQAAAASAEAKRVTAGAGAAAGPAGDTDTQAADPTALALALRDLTLPLPATLAQPGHTPGDILKAYAKLFVLYQNLRQQLLADARLGAYRAPEGEGGGGGGSSLGAIAAGSASGAPQPLTGEDWVLDRVTCGAVRRGAGGGWLYTPPSAAMARLGLALALAAWAALVWLALWSLPPHTVAQPDACPAVSEIASPEQAVGTVDGEGAVDAEGVRALVQAELARALQHPGS